MFIVNGATAFFSIWKVWVNSQQPDFLTDSTGAEYSEAEFSSQQTVLQQLLSDSQYIEIPEIPERENTSKRHTVIIFLRYDFITL